MRFQCGRRQNSWHNVCLYPGGTQRQTRFFFLLFVTYLIIQDIISSEMYDVDIWLNFGCDVGWPKFNVNSTSNVNIKLMSNTDVSCRWDFVFCRLCNQNPTLRQHQILTSTWFSFFNQNATSVQCEPDVTYISGACWVAGQWHFLLSLGTM